MTKTMTRLMTDLHDNLPSLRVILSFRLDDDSDVIDRMKVFVDGVGDGYGRRKEDDSDYYFDGSIRMLCHNIQSFHRDRSLRQSQSSYRSLSCVACLDVEEETFYRNVQWP